jgi:hypothetical protein
MKTELYRSIKNIEPGKLSESDKEDLLKIFDVVDNVLIRDQIAFIFGDSKYDKAVPHIIRKIKDSKTFHNNGSLVYALHGLDVSNFFTDIIDIICTMEYEARLAAYEIIDDNKSKISDHVRANAIDTLQSHLKTLPTNRPDIQENSTRHFIESTIKLLKK